MKKIFISLFFLCYGITINAQDSLTQYTGKYIFPEGSVVTEAEVFIENGSLKISSSSGNSSLTQLGIDSFSIVEYSGTAVFKRNEEKKVNAVHIEVMGYVMDGKKQENNILIFTSYFRSVKNEILRKPD